MKPLILTIAGIGPYKEQQVLDFARTYDAGLFLIHGPTGSGKSSLLEAMCYALYGNTDQEKGSLNNIRSHYMARHEESLVHFEFLLGDAHYRVERYIRCITRKKSGDIEYEEQAHVLKALDDGTFESISSGKKSDASAIIQKLTGLNVEQFKKVILLPQGKFRELLVAGSDEKEKILASLFGTDRFERLENKLKALLSEQQNTCASLQAQLDTLLASAQVQRCDEIATMIDQVLSDLQRVQSQVLEQEQLQQKARRDYADGENLAKTFAELALTESKLLAMQQQDQTMQLEQQRLQQAERLRPVANSLQKLVSLQNELLAFSPQIEAANIELANLTARLHQATETLAKAEYNASACKQQLQEQEPSLLEKLKHHEELSGLQKQLENLSRNCLQLRQSYEQLQAKSQKFEQQKLELDAQKNELLALKTCHAATQNLYRSCNDFMQKIAAWQATKTAAAVLQSELLPLYQHIIDLQTSQKEITCRLADLDSKEQDQYIGWIAQSLNNGDPCPVCGSTEHPAPANLVSKPINSTTGERINLQSALSTLQDDLQQANNTSIASKTRISLLQEELRKFETTQQQGQLDIAERLEEVERHTLRPVAGVTALKTLLTQSSLELSAWQQMLEALTNGGTELKNNIQARSSLLDKPLLEVVSSDALRDTFEKTSSAETQLTWQQEQITSLKFRLSGFPDAAGIQKQLQQLKSALQNAEQWYTSARDEKTSIELEQARQIEKCRYLEQQLSAVNQQALTQESLLKTDLHKLGFDDPVQARHYFMDETAINTLRTELQVWNQKLVQQQALQTQLLLNIAGRPQPDMQALQLALNSADETMNQLQSLKGRQEHQHQVLIDISFAVADIQTELAEHTAALQEIRSLSAIISGNNERKINLQRYALSMYLDEVVEEANILLEQLSDKRYRLERLEELQDGRKKAGLDLCIADEFTGQTRPVRTLSGGESFMASISLAIGLSNVVQSRSGGRKLEALFIDEGFGSLDEDALQSALHMLSAISSRGRLLGIVSHVKELQERVPLRLVIEKSRSGSKIAWAI